MSPAITNDFWCSFCGQPQAQVRKLVAGPDDFCVCDQCVRDAHGVLAGTEHEFSPSGSSITSVSEEDRGKQCSFCGKSRNQMAAMASAADARICDECIALCFEIIDS